MDKKIMLLVAQLPVDSIIIWILIKWDRYSENEICCIINCSLEKAQAHWRNYLGHSLNHQSNRTRRNHLPCTMTAPHSKLNDQWMLSCCLLRSSEFITLRCILGRTTGIMILIFISCFNS